MVGDDDNDDMFIFSKEIERDSKIFHSKRGFKAH